MIVTLSRSFTSTGGGHHLLCGGFQEGDHLRPLHRRKPLQEFIDRVPSLQIVEQGLNWNARPGEARCPSHHIGMAGDNLAFHENMFAPSPRISSQRTEFS